MQAIFFFKLIATQETWGLYVPKALGTMIPGLIFSNSCMCVRVCVCPFFCRTQECTVSVQKGDFGATYRLNRLVFIEVDLIYQIFTKKKLKRDFEVRIITHLFLHFWFNRQKYLFFVDLSQVGTLITRGTVIFCTCTRPVMWAIAQKPSVGFGTPLWNTVTFTFFLALRLFL